MDIQVYIGFDDFGEFVVPDLGDVWFATKYRFPSEFDDIVRALISAGF